MIECLSLLKETPLTDPAVSRHVDDSRSRPVPNSPIVFSATPSLFLLKHLAAVNVEGYCFWIENVSLLACWRACCEVFDSTLMTMLGRLWDGVTFLDHCKEWFSRGCWLPMISAVASGDALIERALANAAVDGSLLPETAVAGANEFLCP